MITHPDRKSSICDHLSAGFAVITRKSIPLVRGIVKVPSRVGTFAGTPMLESDRPIDS